MSAQSVASRSPRNRRPAEGDDVVMARALEFAGWAQQNIRGIVIGAVIAVLLVGGLFYWRAEQAARLERAATEFLSLEQTVGSGNMQLAVQDLQRYVARFDGTPYADEARVLLGQVHLQAGAPAEAVTALSPLAQRIDESPVGAQGALLLSDAQLAAGNTDQAVATLLQVADEAEYSYLQVEALSNAALLRMQAGDYAGAAELYRRLVEGAEPGSPDRSIYEMRMAEAEALARAS